MRVGDVVSVLERVAPPELAEPWDAVGLHVGRSGDAVDGPVLLTIDLTGAVLAEAESLRAAMIVAYHPPIFKPLERLTDATGKQRVLLGAARAGIAVYSPHTALDAAAGGVTDWLCEGLLDGGTGDRRALVPATPRRATEELTLVTSVPASDVDEVRAALATAGAGIEGTHTLCSFAITGVRTFMAGTTTGGPAPLQRVEQVRLEMACARAALALALDTLRQFHPADEPAIEVYERVAQPVRSIGAGRRLVLDRPATPRELAQRLRRVTGSSSVQAALPTGPGAIVTSLDQPITHVGVVPGSGGELAERARRDGCGLFVTGEMSHHRVLEATDAGLAVLLAGHTATERGYLPVLASRLRALLPGVPIETSRADADPLSPLGA